VVEVYASSAREHGVSIPDYYQRAHQLARTIEGRFPAQQDCFCHNDLLNANFIDDGERIWIVDWEYAGMGDPFFDLGNFAVNHQLDEPAERMLVDAYLGRPAGKGEYARLRLMRFMSDFREAMWGVLQLGISRLEFDFQEYARHHFERLESASAEVLRLLEEVRR
jgi:thiamine kinase-like enzyme